ncbi:MAG: ATP-binding protein [Actinomycetota bacterium]
MDPVGDREPAVTLPETRDLPTGDAPGALAAEERPHRPGLDDDAVARIRAVAPVLAGRRHDIAHAFADRLRATPGFEDVAARDRALGVAVDALLTAIDDLADPRLDAARVAAGRRTADAFIRAGLPLETHQATLAAIRDATVRAVLHEGGDPGDQAATIAAVDRLLTADDGTVAACYCEEARTSEERRSHQHVEAASLRVIRDTAAAIFETRADLPATLRVLADAARRALGAERASCYVHSEDGARIEAVYTTEENPRLRHFLEEAVGKTRDDMPIWRHLLESPDPVVSVADIETGPLPRELRDGLGVGAFLGVRLEHTSVSGDGRPIVLGSLFASWAEPQTFTPEDRLNATNLATLGALALANARLRASRLHLEVELRQAQKLEAIGQLAAGVAHEINTPIQFVGDSVYFLTSAFDDLLGLISSYRALAEAAATGTVEAELLDEIGETEAEIDLDELIGEIPEALERTTLGAERVSEIVRAMKEFAHPQEAEQAVADLNHAIQSTLTVARNELKYVADVETDLQPIPPVTCHIGDVNQVVLNLLVNAAHAITEAIEDAEPGTRGVIRVSTSAEDGVVTISVSDTGKGIPEDIQGRIYDPFFTTKEVGRGTGQGLAISRTIVVEKHGGAIDFDTTPGVGTTFHVRLPVDGKPAPDTATT